MNYVLTLFLVILSIPSSSQIEKSEGVEVHHLPSEKVFIRTDRLHYEIGDRIYYKCYLPSKDLGLGKPQSKILYVDLVAPDSSIVSSQILKIENGTAMADIAINLQYSSGIYHMRGYTKYLQNFEQAAWYNGNIIIHGVQDLPESKGVQPEYTVGFYPEGGYLVDGVESKIGIKAEDQWGIGISAVGHIRDQHRNIIADFVTNKFGFGIITMIPKVDEVYTVEVPAVNLMGLDVFPTVLSKGILIKQQDYENDKSLDLQILTAGHIFSKGFELKITSRGQVFYKQALKGQHKESMSINWDDLPMGILHCTLYEGSKRPISEILAFNYHGVHQYFLDIEGLRSNYSQREEVSVALDIYNDDGDPLNPSLHISVVDTNYIDGDCADLRTYLLLQSEIKGRIEEPCRYFTGSDAEMRKNMALLLLTQGWRRYKWVAATNPHHPEQTISISGRITALTDSTKGVVGEGFISEISGKMTMTPFLTDDQGYFTISNLTHSGPANFLIQAQKFRRDRKGTLRGDKIELRGNRDVIITVNDREIAPVNFFTGSRSVNMRDSGKDILINHRIKRDPSSKDWDGLQADLPEVVIPGKRIENLMVDYYSQGMLYNRPDERIIVADLGSPERYSGQHGVFNILKTHLSNASITGLPLPDGIDYHAMEKAEPRVMLRGSAALHSSTTKNDGARFLINGAHVSPNAVLNLDPSRVAFIDVIKSLNQLAAFGEMGSGGVIAIYLKPPGHDTQVITRQKGILSFTHEGFYEARDFYQPPYGSTKGKISAIDDRVTLHWQPEIPVFEGEANISFYTSDRKGRYQILIEGITSDGLPVFCTKHFDVR